jgi:hypothetical protein
MLTSRAGGSSAAAAWSNTDCRARLSPDQTVWNSAKTNIVVPYVLIEAAFVIEGHGTPLEQRISAGYTRRGVAQPIAGQAVVAIAVRTDNLNHAFEHLASESGLPPPRASGALMAFADSMEAASEVP